MKQTKFSTGELVRGRTGKQNVCVAGKSWTNPDTGVTWVQMFFGKTELWRPEDAVERVPA